MSSNFGRNGPTTCYIKSFAPANSTGASWNFVWNNLKSLLITPANKNASVLISGDLTVNGHFYNLSDASTKANINHLGVDVVSKLHELRPVSYTAISTGDTSYGFLAQDVQSQYPELVKDFGAKGVSQLRINYIALIPILVHEVQSHRDKIAALESSTRNSLDPTQVI